MIIRRVETGDSKLENRNCKNIKQLFTKFVAISLVQVLLVPLSLYAAEISFSKENDRSPANFIPSEHLDTISLESEELWIDKIMIEDDAGVLRSMKDTIESWDKKEKYIILWNQENSGLVDIPTDTAKKAYLTKQFLKYLDKRLSGEIKHAEKGSALHQVGIVHKALRPKTKVQISKNIKLRFKARLLQGKGIIVVENPYVECNANFNYSGNANVRIGKNFKKPGIKTEIDYSIDAERWIASVSKKISPKVTGRISSSQNSNETPIDGNADKRFEVFFVHNF